MEMCPNTGIEMHPMTGIEMLVMLGFELQPMTWRAIAARPFLRISQEHREVGLELGEVHGLESGSL
jgi:hypothetical protein